jgi:hypothetical protein
VKYFPIQKNKLLAFLFINERPARPLPRALNYGEPIYAQVSKQTRLVLENADKKTEDTTAESSELPKNTTSYISESGSKFSVISPYSLDGKGGPSLRSESAVVFFGNSLDSAVVSSVFLSAFSKTNLVCYMYEDVDSAHVTCNM